MAGRSRGKRARQAKRGDGARGASPRRAAYLGALGAVALALIGAVLGWMVPELHGRFFGAPGLRRQAAQSVAEELVSLLDDLSTTGPTDLRFRADTAVMGYAPLPPTPIYAGLFSAGRLIPLEDGTEALLGRTYAAIEAYRAARQAAVPEPAVIRDGQVMPIDTLRYREVSAPLVELQLQALTRVLWSLAVLQREEGVSLPSARARFVDFAREVSSGAMTAAVVVHAADTASVAMAGSGTRRRLLFQIRPPGNDARSLLVVGAWPSECTFARPAPDHPTIQVCNGGVFPGLDPRARALVARAPGDTAARLVDVRINLVGETPVWGP